VASSCRDSTARNFALDPTGTLLQACNQQADTIVQFRLNTATGQLTATGQVTQTPTPVCLVFAILNRNPGETYMVPSVRYVGLIGALV